MDPYFIQMSNFILQSAKIIFQAEFSFFHKGLLIIKECARDKLVDRTAACRMVRCQGLNDGELHITDCSPI